MLSWSTNLDAGQCIPSEKRETSSNGVLCQTVSGGCDNDHGDNNCRLSCHAVRSSTRPYGFTSRCVLLLVFLRSISPRVVMQAPPCCAAMSAPFHHRVQGLVARSYLCTWEGSSGLCSETHETHDYKRDQLGLNRNLQKRSSKFILRRYRT